MRDGRRQRVALLGEGEPAAAWKAALPDRVDLCPMLESADHRVDAVVVAPGSENPFARAREALLAGHPVLFAASFALSPWQARLLDEISRRQRRLLRFIEPFRYQEGFPFLKRLLEGREPFWKPLYLRALAVGKPHAHVRLEDLATEELALCDSLTAGRPESVSAAAAHIDEVGEVCASLLTVQYDGGPPVQCTISLVEATPARQLVAVAPDRTVVMDRLNSVSPLRIIGADSESDEVLLANKEEGAWGSCVPCEETKRFLHAVATQDLSYGNSDRWARVAAIWSAARQSMSFGGSVRVPVVRPTVTPPPLRVIEGGGSARAARQRPALTIVG